MNRKISQQDLDSEIRSYLAGAGAAEPASLGDVLNRLPDRNREPHRSFPVLTTLPRFAALAVVLILAAAAVGVPLLMSKPSPAVDGQTTSPAATVASGTFAPTGSMTTPRQGATAVRLLDGRVLVAGGSSDPETALASAELYDPKTGTFSATGSMSTARNAYTVTLLRDGRVLFAGGSDDIGALASAELYDPATGRFSATGSLTSARDGHTATLLSNGLVLIAGGQGGYSAVLASAELYDPATGRFSATGSMTVARTGHSAAPLADGRVLIAGGQTTTEIAGETHLSVLASAELYDPSTGKFSPTGSMTATRELPTVIRLSDGRVLFAGGSGGGPLGQGAVTSAELYDPTTGQFSRTGSMSSSGYWQAGALLSDGRLLVAGGMTVFAKLDTAQLYDPKSGTFSLTGSLITGRDQATATLLDDGRVLLAGGVGPGGTVLASAELYQP